MCSEKIPHVPKLTFLSEFFAQAGAMQPPLNDSKVVLSDPDYESAATLRIFLSLAKTWKMPEIFDCGQHLSRLVSFLDKYRCVGPISVLCESLRYRVNNVNYISVFEVASRFDDKVLAVKVCNYMTARRDTAGPQVPRNYFNAMVEHCLCTCIARNQLSREFHYILFRAVFAMTKTPHGDAWAALAHELEKPRA